MNYFNYPDVLYIENFKAFGPEQRVPLRPLTLIYGQNSSGKSSILQALALLSTFQISGVRNVNDITLNGNKIRLEGFQNYLHANSKKRKITLGWECTSDNTDTIKRFVQRVSIDGHGAELDDENPGVHSGYSYLGEWEIEENGKKAFRMVPGTRTIEPHLDPHLKIDLENHQNSSYLETALREAIEFLPEWLVGEILKRSDLDDETKHTKEFRCRTKSAFAKLIEESENGALDKYIGYEFFRLLKRVKAGVEKFPPKLRKPDIEGIIRLSYEDESRGPVRKLHLDIDLRSDSYEHIKSQIVVAAAQLAVDLLYKYIDQVPVSVFGTYLYFGKFREQLISNEIINHQQMRESRGESMLGELYAKGWSFSEIGIHHLNWWLERTQRPDLNYKIKLVRFTARGESDKGLYYTIRLFDKRRKVNVSFDNVGSGIGQILPVLMGAFNEIQSCIAVEQPELHLHPALQSEIADAFALCALGLPEDPPWLRNNKIILETHSEHILLRLMRRIRETTKGTLPSHLPKINPKDVAVLYVERVGKHSVVRELRLNEQGELIDDWPGGFFEEGLRELLM